LGTVRTLAWLWRHTGIGCGGGFLLALSGIVVVLVAWNHAFAASLYAFVVLYGTILAWGLLVELLRLPWIDRRTRHWFARSDPIPLPASVYIHWLAFPLLPLLPLLASPSLSVWPWLALLTGWVITILVETVDFRWDRRRAKRMGR